MSWPIHRWLVISLLLFKGCQSLFLRHTQSGKCIGVGSSFSVDSWAIRRWAEMVNNCLNVSAQFRYLDTAELLNNIETGGTFLSEYKNARYKKRFIVYEAKNRHGRNFEKKNRHHLKQTASGSLFLYEVSTNSCAQPNGIYVDQKKDGCSNATEQKFTFGSVTPYGTKMKDVHCSPAQLMVVKKAYYGDFNNSGTFDGNKDIDTKCAPLTNCKVKSHCSGKRSCELTIGNKLLLLHICSDTTKELYTEYTCVDRYSSITAAPKIGLGGANEGFINVYDGSIWRKVNEENWDKNREKMLCHHLGFSETDANYTSTREIGGNVNVATGDLICYNTQPNGTSCCVHLRPSKAISNLKVPYVTCKICDKPLLINVSAFPDSIFSGSGSSNYQNARFTESGWCASKSGSYLLLDLQKEYHITRVVVMGDKEQRKWSGSYSLTYSHDIALVDSSSAVLITGNQNGYQASTTIIDICNVRHIKIQSTGNKNFCLRIELCGEAEYMCGDSEKSEQSCDEKIRVDLLIPLAILALCFLLSLGVNIYQRRLLQNNKREASHKPQTLKRTNQKEKNDSILEHLNSNKSIKGVQAAPRDSFVDNDTEYEDADYVTKCIERNEAESTPDISTGQESLTYITVLETQQRNS